MRSYLIALVALVGLALPAFAEGPKLSGVQPAVTLFTPPTVCTGPNCQGQTACPGGCVNCPTGYCTSGECGMAGCNGCTSCNGYTHTGRPFRYRVFHPFGGRFRR